MFSNMTDLGFQSRELLCKLLFAQLQQKLTLQLHYKSPGF